MSAGLAMWVIYDHPRDFPDEFVARKWAIMAEGALPTGEVLTATSLEGIRSRIQLEAGMSGQLARSEADDPCIVESWI